RRGSVKFPVMIGFALPEFTAEGAMPRTPVIGIDELGGYIQLAPSGADTPGQDYYVMAVPSADPAYGTITIWGSGFISFGAPTADQQAYVEAHGGDVSSFPGDYAMMGPFSGNIEVIE